MEAVVATGLVKRYGFTEALRGLDLRVRTGSIHGLLGPNGAGKTTTVKILVGLVKRDAGEVRVFGEDPFLDARIRRRIGYVPEIPSLPQWAQVGELLVAYGRMQGLSRAEAEESARRSLERLEAMELWDRRISGLSKGQRQRVSIAQAIMGQPDLLILDEPLIGLDPEGMRIVRNLVEEEARRGAAVLVNTHLLREAEDMCDRVTVIIRGRSVFEGGVEELKRRTGGGRVLIVGIRGDPRRAADLLRSLEYVERVELLSRSRLRVILGTGEDVRAEVSRILVENGIGIVEFRVLEPSLEDAFLKIAGR